MPSLQDAVEMVRSSGAPCLFCGDAATAVGAFAPTRPEYRAAVGAPAGKTRVLLYPVCTPCAEYNMQHLEYTEVRVMHAFGVRDHHHVHPRSSALLC